MWFATVEAQFSTRGIVQDQTRFDYVLTGLDADTEERIADFFDDLPESGNRYEAFKARVLDSFRINRHRRMANIASLTIGDDNPSRLLERMLGLYRPDANASMNPLFRSHLLQKLPAHVRDQVAAVNTLDLREVAKIADRIFAQRLGLAKSAVEDVAVEVDAVERPVLSKKRLNVVPASKTPGVCKYHARFGEQSRSCILPCAWNGKLAPGNGKAGRP
ncbi:uncharacterized protein LOC108864852 [Galendromus occidentalis]|uniref:Uncharacterized protein LOC108864852 n=1 Tax=Galendromus occidentalis TaxID=34638 RepID=A0AAJ7L5X5_9ACAR|nr:uncharacterized protein LOC108864852 [Galendromus occidentalis]